MIKPRIAFVVQRSGDDVNGGAERIALTVARVMAPFWDVEIITTCARDYVTWANYYDAGVEERDGITIRRFAVDAPRDIVAFDRSTPAFKQRLARASLAEQEAWMKAQGPYSAELLRYIERERTSFELFFFFTYLYATTYFGLPLVAEKAWLVPFAHDEWMIRAPMWDAFFALPTGIVFSTAEERAFLTQRFPHLTLRGPVIGSGITIPERTDPQGFRNAYGISNPFIVYLGRIDRAKGVDDLLVAFKAYKRMHPDDLELVLIGRAERPIPKQPSVRALGFIEDDRKLDALAAAEAVVMPSKFESLSLALLEAWSVRTPVLVTGASAVLVGQTRRAQGGLWFDNDAEFASALTILRGPIGRRLGNQGHNFVVSEYRWQRVIDAYEQIRRSGTAGSGEPVPRD